MIIFLPGLLLLVGYVLFYYDDKAEKQKIKVRQDERDKNHADWLKENNKYLRGDYD